VVGEPVSPTRLPLRADQRPPLAAARSLARGRDPARALIRAYWHDRVAGRLARAAQSARVHIARDELRRVRELTRAINDLERELATLTSALGRRLLAKPGCGALTVAKQTGEIAGADRFATETGSDQVVTQPGQLHQRILGVKCRPRGRG
jgi:hypothetical protein